MKILVCLIIISQLLFGEVVQPTVPKNGVGTSRIVVVLPFENSTGTERYEVLENLVMELLSNALNKVKDIKVVERQKLYQIADEQKLSLTGLLDEKNQIEIGKVFGANSIIYGGCAKNNSNLKINAHIFDLSTAKLVRSEEIEGNETEIIRLINELSTKLVKDLDKEKPKSNGGETVTWVPENAHFVKGLEYYYGCLYDQAITEFMNVLQSEPVHVDAVYWRGWAYFENKELSHARVDFERVVKLFPDYRYISKTKELLKKCGENNEEK